MGRSDKPTEGMSSAAPHAAFSGVAGPLWAPTGELAIRATYMLILCGDLPEMRRALSLNAAGSLPSVVLKATIAQQEGRMDRCRSFYERALQAAPRADLAYVVDLIAPFLIMNGDDDRYAELRAGCDIHPELVGPFAAMDAITAARRGDGEASLIAAHIALECADCCDSDALNGRIIQRLAYAALRRRDFAEAAELATRGARTLESAGAHRAAAMAYSIAYNVHHAGTGDFDRAETFAGKIVDAARRAGDASLENLGLIAQYEMACECGDDDIARLLRERIDTLALPEQYAERFARGVGDVILAAIRNDLMAFHANAVLLRDVLAPDRATMALASALRSLAAAALGELGEARRSARNALGLASVAETAEAAYSVRYRKLARALAASTCLLIGDTVRAHRATVRHFERDEHGLLILLRIAEGASSSGMPRRIRGYAYVVATVRDVIRQSYRRSQLSEAEYDVLILLAQGLSAPQIAIQTDRSVHTIRAHTRAIITKFAVRGRSAAIAHAQKHGFLS